MDEHLVEPPELLQQRAEIDMRVDDIRAQREDPLVMHGSLGELAPLAQRHREMETRCYGIRRTIGRVGELRHRLVEPPEPMQRRPEIAERFAVVRLERNRLGEACRRLTEPALGGEDRAVIVVHLGDIGRERERAADEVDGVRPSQLVGDDAEQVQRARVHRIGGADEAVETLGLGETAGAMVLHGGGELRRGWARGVHAGVFGQVLGKLSCRLSCRLSCKPPCKSSWWTVVTDLQARQCGINRSAGASML